MEAVLDKYIEVTPPVRGGKPRIVNTRITVDDIVLMHLRLGQSLEVISGKYQLPLAAVYSAIAYYYDHQGEVDQRIAADMAFAEAFQRQNTSPLQEKLSVGEIVKGIS